MHPKKLKYRVCLMLFLLFVSMACLNQTENDHIAYGDVLIKSYLEGDSIVYSTQFHAYSWYTMTDVVAYSENGNTSTELEKFNSNYSFAYLPEKSNYTTTIPEASKFTFEILFEDGTSYTSIDFLDSLVIDPPTISEVSFDDEKDSFYLKWKSVSNAQYYSVFLMNEEKEIAFESELIDQSETQIWINEYSYGWKNNKKPDSNTSYKVVVNAYLFEPVATTFDIQCVAVNDMFSIEWLIN